ncbi:acyl-CoA dehydrogenase [Amycolatopsis acidicola]|uniref:Acyl-CoA dehydrogenase n=1 Tax=Amycolatopsis acidicola TaxID=2596893 RepID=A0A5N0VEP3_9PSEU|nr:acyl-CoA dehydrogenase family protein [Amycolatopsis acidicola]KAA9163301.1 acyl-CoA dehydrogenase [Amycolatopsis acidicola]
MTALSGVYDADRYVAVQNALDESASDRLLDDRELAVRARVRDVVAAEVAPRAEELDRTHTFAHDSYQALAAAGLAGLIFPKRWGGTEDTNVAYAVAMEEIAAGCAATSLVYMTQMHAAYPIWKAGTEELASRYIPGLLDGTRYGSLGITEPDAGSDAASLKTRAVPRTEHGQVVGYTVIGSKTFITTGDRADVVVCFATVDPAMRRKGITALVVDGDSAGLTRGQPFVKMGMHGSSTAELFLSGVEVPAGNRLGAEGDGWPIVLTSVIKSRISAAAQGVGIARSVYGRTLTALRCIHGKRFPDEATFALADLRGEILRGRLLLLAIAREVDREESPSPGQIGIMKQSCTDLGFRAAVEAARILGPHGDLADLGVERGLRDAKVTQIYDGTNEVQRLLIGRDTARKVEELV